MGRHATFDVKTGQMVITEDDAETGHALASFRPAQIVAAFKTWGVLEQIVANTPPATLAEFYTAESIVETDARLFDALHAVGKTIQDLKDAL